MMPNDVADRLFGGKRLEDDGDGQIIRADKVVILPNEILKIGNIEMTSNCSQLFKALAKVQGKIKHPDKNKTAKANSFSYNYADLPNVIDAYRKEFSDAGIAVVQGASSKDSDVSVTSILGFGCDDGRTEFIACTTGMKASDSKPQSIGSAITYARRYSSQALVNIFADLDDDGSEASKSTAPRQHRNLREELKKPGSPTYVATLDQKNHLAAIAKNQLGLTDPSILKVISDYCIGKPLEDLETHMGEALVSTKV